MKLKFRVLTKEQNWALVHKYADTNASMELVAKLFSISTSQVRKTLHIAILENKVDDSLALKIAKKASKKSSKVNFLLNGKGARISRYYKTLLLDRILYKKISEEISNLQVIILNNLWNRILQANFAYGTYEEFISSSDEEDYQLPEIDELKAEFKKLKKNDFSSNVDLMLLAEEIAGLRKKYA